jgi:hypothetical protein
MLVVGMPVGNAPKIFSSKYLARSLILVGSSTQLLLDSLSIIELIVFAEFELLTLASSSTLQSFPASSQSSYATYFLISASLEWLF